MSTKKRVLIGIILGVVLTAAVLIVILLNEPRQYNYNLSDYIKVAKYKGVEVLKHEADKVTEKDIQKVIDEELNAVKTTKKKKNGTVNKGDVCNINYVGKINGKKFDGGSAEDASATAGKKSAYIDGFESGLVGMKIGETKKLKLKFPNAYQNNEVAGKNVEFTVTVTSVNIDIVPKLDEDFVKKNTKYSTVSEYKAGVKKKIKEKNKNSQIEQDKYKIWSQLVADSKVIKYPKEELKAAKASAKKSLENYAKQMGSKINDFRKQMGLEKDDDYNKYIKEQAETSVKNAMVVYYIADKEKIKLDTNAGKAMKKMIEDAGYNDSTFESNYGMSIDKYVEENKNEYEISLMTKEVLDFIYGKVKFVDKLSPKKGSDFVKKTK